MLTLLLLACRTSASPPAASTAAIWEGHELVEIGLSELPADRPACTVVAMHGFGDAPESFAALFRGMPGPVQVVLPRAPSQVGPRGWDWFDTPKGERPRRDPEIIGRRADELVEGLPSLPVKRPMHGKPVITGFSQGGMLAYAMAVRHPDALRASLPVGGWLPESMVPEGGPTVPIVGFHGSLDQVVELKPTADAVSALKAAGWPAELRVYEGVPHSVPPSVRADLHAAITRACAE